MKWVILNGSPKGATSVTMQSMKYLELTHGDHTFEYIHIVNNMKDYENKPAELIETCEKIQNADVVLWAFPLYHLLVHSSYKRFIELVSERHLERYFENKYTASFSTSIHFFDHTAHQYINGICDDFGMQYVEQLSHDMNDLTKEDKRKELQNFFKSIVYSVDHTLAFPKTYEPIMKMNKSYNATLTNPTVKTNKKITIITDAKEMDHNLNQMIQKFKSTVIGNVSIENLNTFTGNGPCLGCCKCAYDNTCVYEHKDDYRARMDAIIQNTDILIFAGTIKDRYLSARFKWFFDRSFCYTHIPIYSGKQIGFLISGPFIKLKNVRQILEGYTQMDANLIGFISDEVENDFELDQHIEAFAEKAILYSENGYERAPNFLGVGGRKIFRDEVAGNLGAIFKGDYQYYKAHDFFDFPTSKDRLKAMLMRYFMGKKRFRDEVQKNMKNHMIASHKKVLKKVEDGLCQ